MTAFRTLALVLALPLIAHAGPYEDALRRDEARRRDIEWQDRAYGWKNGSPFSAPSPSRGADCFAAIAYSPSTKKHAYSFGHSTRAAAEQTALARCKESDARIVSWTRNAYTALAIGADGTWGASWGNTRAQAESNALKECRKNTTTGCRIACWAFSGN